MIPTKEEMYAALEERHGREIQEKFLAASVAVCGLGGLGSNAAIALARAGVGRLHLIDFDSVDTSNLNRQQYFPDQLGHLSTCKSPQQMFGPLIKTWCAEKMGLDPANVFSASVMPESGMSTSLS